MCSWSVFDDGKRSVAGKEFITTCTETLLKLWKRFSTGKGRKSYALNGGRESGSVARSNGSSIAKRLSFRARLPDNPKLGTIERIQPALVTRYLCKRCIVCII